MINTNLKFDFREKFMKRRSIKRFLLFFVIGAVGYAAIETIWRGYTHWSMMLAGGISFLLFSIVAEKLRGKSLLLKAAVCGLCVTAVEFVFGVVFNLWLGMGVWDYSHVPMNILGQVCPIFSLIWIGLAIAFMPFVEALNKDYA